MGQAEGTWSCLWAAVAAVGGGQGGWALRGWVQERESRESMQDKKVSTWGLQWAANPRGIWGYGQAVAGGSRGKISTEKLETHVEDTKLASVDRCLFITLVWFNNATHWVPAIAFT